LINADDFLETVVAYANTNNGTVFIGVDDEGNIAGLKIPYEELLEK
jgi:predicted HTH transcriptional regulator